MMYDVHSILVIHCKNLEKSHSLFLFLFQFFLSAHLCHRLHFEKAISYRYLTDWAARKDITLIRLRLEEFSVDRQDVWNRSIVCFIGCCLTSDFKCPSSSR